MPDAALPLSGSGLTLDALDPPPARIALAPEARARCERSRAVVDEVLAQGRTVYGVNTGLGRLASQRIPEERQAELQAKLCRSHAAGVGPALPPATARLMLLLRAQALAKGHSGVRTELIERICRFYDEELIPVVPSQGSVGASGDLAPLAHLALGLIGEGELWQDGAPAPAPAVLAARGVEPFALAAKEGLALVNGTQCMSAIGVEALLLARRLVASADVAAAMSLEALRGTDQPFLACVHDARGQEGQRAVAANLRALLEGSEILPSHRDCSKVQDAYSLRCAPQVHGAVRDALGFAEGVLERELNAATDNPLVFEDGSIVSAGNFHGQPVAQALDFVAIALATLSNISERRTENLVNPDLSGLPAFLAADPGVDSGLMIAQVVAASLASENKSLAHPASVDTIPTSANREDHVSMGVTAARHALAVAENCARVLGIECLCAAQALEQDRSLRAGRGVEAAFAALRAEVPALDGDRFLAPDLRSAERLVRAGTLAAAAETKDGA